jgi:hypothetical protein
MVDEHLSKLPASMRESESQANSKQVEGELANVMASLVVEKEKTT